MIVETAPNCPPDRRRCRREMEELSILVPKRIKPRIVLKRVWSPYGDFSSPQAIFLQRGAGWRPAQPDRIKFMQCPEAADAASVCNMSQ